MLKAVAPELEHKTEAGGVRLGVPADTAAGRAGELLETVADAVLVQEQVAPGVELLVSVAGGRDDWPPVLTVGWGGTGTEIHHDVAHALAPVSPTTAQNLLEALPAGGRTVP